MTSQTERCIKRLQKAVDELLAEGADPTFIASALAEVTVTTAEKDPETTLIVIDSVAAILDATAKAKRGRNVMEAFHEAIFKS